MIRPLKCPFLKWLKWHYKLANEYDTLVAPILSYFKKYDLVAVNQEFVLLVELKKYEKLAILEGENRILN